MILKKGKQRKAVEILTNLKNVEIKRDTEVSYVRLYPPRIQNYLDIDSLMQAAKEGGMLSSLQESILALYRKHRSVLAAQYKTRFVNEEYPLLCEIIKLMQQAAFGDISAKHFYNRTKKYLTRLGEYKESRLKSDNNSIANLYDSICKLISNCYDNLVISLLYELNSFSADVTSIISSFSVFKPISYPEAKKYEEEHKNMSSNCCAIL